MRCVDASFWSSERAVCELLPEVSGALGLLLSLWRLRPLILMGDALAGKPFYTASTLNRHLWDVAQLVHEAQVGVSVEGEDLLDLVLFKMFSFHDLYARHELK